MIELLGVSKKFRSKKVLHSVNCTIMRGQKVLLSGPNGAGKTTLLKIMAGMNKPDHGTVVHQSQDVWQNIQDFRSNVGLLLDESFLYADLSLRENLKFYAKLYLLEGAEEKISAWVEKLDMQSHLHTEVANLSKGERQKASIIRSLLHEPPLLLLDEPMSGLDQNSKSMLANILSQHPATVIFSAHEDMSAQAWIQRRLSLQQGHLVEQHA